LAGQGVLGLGPESKSLGRKEQVKENQIYKKRFIEFHRMKLSLMIYFFIQYKYPGIIARPFLPMAGMPPEEAGRAKPFEDRRPWKPEP
jgi:hypothetical protein